MYNYSAPLLWEPRKEIMGLADRLGHLVTSQHHVEVLARALPPVLKCCSVVRGQPWGGRRHDRGPLSHPWQPAGAQPGLGDCHLVDPYPLASGSSAESRGAVGYEVQEPVTAVVAGQRCTWTERRLVIRSPRPERARPRCAPGWPRRRPPWLISRRAAKESRGARSCLRCVRRRKRSWRGIVSKACCGCTMRNTCASVLSGATARCEANTKDDMKVFEASR